MKNTLACLSLLPLSVPAGLEQLWIADAILKPLVCMEHAPPPHFLSRSQWSKATPRPASARAGTSAPSERTAPAAPAHLLWARWSIISRPAQLQASQLLSLPARAPAPVPASFLLPFSFITKATAQGPSAKLFPAESRGSKEEWGSFGPALGYWCWCSIAAQYKLSPNLKAVKVSEHFSTLSSFSFGPEKVQLGVTYEL